MASADPDSLLKIVEELRPVVLAHRADTDRVRHLPDAIAAAMVQRNLYRALLPTDLGGLGADAVTYWRMIEAFSALDGSVGWNFAIAGGTSLIAGLMPRNVALEIFSGPESCVAGGLAPTGTALAVDGGYRLSGRWAWASGIRQSTWITAAALLQEGNPPAPVKGGPPLAQFVVPRAQVNVFDTWHTGGLRGTGSNDYEIRDVFVPSERSFRLFFGPALHDAPIFRLPSTYFGVGISAVALGIARRAVEAFVELATVKRPMMSANVLAERVYAQYDVAKAEALVESSHDYLLSGVEEMWAHVLAGDPVSSTLRARIRRAQVHAAESAAEAVALVHRAAGGSSLYETCPLERAFRDVHAVLGHITVSRPMAEDAGRVRLGLRPLSPIF